MYKVMIRPGIETDRQFIYSTWLKGLYFGNDLYREIDRGAYDLNYKKAVAAILERSNILVACLPDDTDTVLGYAVFRDKTLHWVHVKRAWRKAGIAKQVVPEGIDTVTHLTKVGDSIRKKKGLVFNPFAL